MFRRGTKAPPAPEHLASNGTASATASNGPDGDAAAARAESLRADLAGIAARIGGLTGTGPNLPPTVEAIPSELISRLDRLAVMAEPGFATIELLRRSWDGIVEDLTAWKMARDAEFGSAVESAMARFEKMAIDVEEQQQRNLAQFTEQSQSQLAALSDTIDTVHSRLDRLTEITRPLPSALEHLREGQGRLGAESADAIIALTALDERLHQGRGEAADDLMRRLDRLESVAGSGVQGITELRSNWDTRLDRLESLAGPGFATIHELRRSWDELMVKAATTDAERGDELAQAIAAVSSHFEMIVAQVDQRQHRQLAEFTELGEERLVGLSTTLDIVGSRLDHLTAIAQQTPAAIERLRNDQARIGAESTQAFEAALDDRMSQYREQPIGADVDSLDERIRQSTEQVMAPVLARLDEFATMTGEGLETIHNLCLGLDGFVGQITLSSEARDDGLTQALEATSGRIEAMIVDLDRRHYRHLVDFSDQGDGRMAALSASFDTLGSRLDRLTEITEPIAAELEGLRHGQGHLSAESAVGAADALAAFEEVRSRLDHLTEVAETVLVIPDALERMRREQDRLGANVDTAVAAMVETADDVKQLRQQQQTPASAVFEHMSRLGEELEGASDRLRETSQQMAQDGQDRRGQMATLDLGLRVALTGMEAVVTGRQTEQVAQLKDAQREVVESVLEGLSRFGRQVDAGLQQATEELTTSVFLTHEDSDHRSHALQEDLTKALSRVEEAELGREEQLVDLRRVVDRLTREVQLLRPAIDLRSGPNGGLVNGVALDRFADRVAALLSQEVLARLEQGGPASDVPKPALIPAPIHPPDE